MASNFPGLKDPLALSRFGRLAAARRAAEDDYAAVLANRAALRRAIQGEPEPAMSRVPTPAEFKLTSDIQKANAEPRPTSAFDVLRRELPRFFRENDELADRVGDFSLAQGALASAGLGMGVALPATLPASLPLATRIAGGVALSNAGDALMSPGAKKVIGTDVMDPTASSLFGGVLGAKGKLLPAFAAAVAGSTGDAQGAGFLRRLIDLPGPARTARRYTPDERVALLNELAPYARPKKLDPKASHILTSVLDDSVKQNETTVLYDQFNKPISMYSMAGRGSPFDDSEYLSGLVSLNGPQGTGRQAAQHAARNSPLEGFRLFSTPTSKGFWDRIVETEPDWSLQYMPEHELSAYRYLPPIKLAGGGSVSGAAKRLAQRAMSQAGDVDPVVAPRGALSVIKNKGGNWLNGSVEDAVSGLKKPGLQGRSAGTSIPPGTYDIGGNILQIGEDFNTRQWTPGEYALNSFVDKQLTRYIKNEMATPEDPIRALAERGVLHFEPNEIPGQIDSRVYGRRMNTGNNQFGVASSPTAKAWEHQADLSVRPMEARDFSAAERELTFGGKSVPPDTQVFDVAPSLHTNTRFNHLIDELSNALNPESGLPRHLLLDPKSMPRVSVPQAVERVSAINAWRAAQKAEADALRANNAATRIHKEYAENNPLGLRWVELKKADLPEGWAQEGTAYVNPADPKAKWRYPEDELRDALKYEGDTMGHCVGGYCDGVLAGRSRIYSLRDAKGQPHVTIETAPDTKKSNRTLDAFRREMGREPISRQELDDFAIDNGGDFVDNSYARIVQIKGKGNAKPHDDYLPFVQDFIKSGQWSDVGDLQNTGLKRLGSEYYLPSEMDDLAKTRGQWKFTDSPDWETLPELIERMRPKYAAKYADPAQYEKDITEHFLSKTGKTLGGEEWLNTDYFRLKPIEKAGGGSVARAEKRMAQGGLVEDMIEQNLDALVEKQLPRQMSRGGSVRTPIRAKIEKMTSELRQCRN